MRDWRVLPSDVSSLDASRMNATPSQEAPLMLCNEMFADPLGNACRCTREAHPGETGHRGVVVTPATFTPTTERPQGLGRRVSFWNAERATWVSVYDGIAAGMDTEGGRWQVVCEKHATILSVDKFTQAHSDARNDPGEFCEACRGEDIELPNGDVIPATQACRECGAEFPYDEEADICPACVKVNTVTLVTLQVTTLDGVVERVNAIDLEGNDAVEWRAELRDVVADPDVRRVLVLEAGHVIYDWSRVKGVA